MTPVYTYGRAGNFKGKSMMSEDWKQYDGSYAVRMKHGFDLFLRPACEYSRKRFIYKVAESNELDFLATKSFENFVCLDIGANIGYWSLWLGGRNIKQLHAFEPDPITFGVLKKNTQSILGHIVCNNIAVGREDGRLDLYVDPDHSGDNRPIQTSGRRSISVPSVTIDQYCSNFETVDFIKIDIQGGEQDALSGATNVLTSYRPTIFVEVCPKSFGLDEDAFGDFLSRLIKDFNMKAYRVVDGEFCVVPCDELASFEGNLIINPRVEWMG